MTTSPTQGEHAQPDHAEAEIVFAAMASGDWKITRNQPSGYMTDEGNARNAWTVERATAPYCADLGPGKGWGNRHWNAPTALEALQAASKEMGITLPAPPVNKLAKTEHVPAVVLENGAESNMTGGDHVAPDHATWFARQQVRISMDPDEAKLLEGWTRLAWKGALRVSNGQAPAGATVQFGHCADCGRSNTLDHPDCKPTTAQAAPAGAAVPQMSAEAVRALPAEARAYIHQLEANTDPAGMVRENMQLCDTNAGLQTMYRKAADALQEVIGCFGAASDEGLAEALAETTDERLKDLLERRLMYALYAAQEAVAHPAPTAQAAPAPTHEQIAAYLEATGAYVTNDATREAAIADAVATDRASHGQAPAGATDSFSEYGAVTTHSVTGRQFFYAKGESPYLDNASACVTVYAKEKQPRQDDQDAAQVAGHDASGTSATCGTGANPHHEHRAWQSVAQREDPECDSGCIGVLGTCDVSQEVIHPSTKTQAEPAGAADETWCAYVAGMICTYLKEDAEGSKAKAIAGIIARRLMFLSRPTAQAAPAAGNWIAADDVQRLVRELDVALNGKEGAATQASLCDVVAQVVRASADLGRPVLEAPAAGAVAGRRLLDEIQRLAQFADTATRMGPRDMHNNMETLAQELTNLLDAAPTPAAQADSQPAPDIFSVLDAFEGKQRGIPQAHIAAALVQELRAAIEASAQADSGVQEDAARYRWLRDNWFTMDSNYQGCITFRTGQPRWSELTVEDLDAAIDAAKGAEDVKKS